MVGLVIGVFCFALGLLFCHMIILQVYCVITFLSLSYTCCTLVCIVVVAPKAIFCKFLTKKFLNKSLLKEKVDKIVQSFAISDDDLNRLIAAMDRELGRGLSKETNTQAEIKMLPTYVTSTPDGSGDNFFCI